MAYLSDTDRVELALPAHMMLAVLLSGANIRKDPGPEASDEDRKAWETYSTTKTHLFAACEEPLSGLYPEKKQLSVMRRIERIHAKITLPYIKAEAEVRKVGLIAYYLVKALVESNYINIPEESSFGQALDHMLPALSPWEGNSPSELEAYERLTSSAQKQFRHVLKQLQAEGYYRGLEPT